MNQLAKCDTKITQAEKMMNLVARQQSESESDGALQLTVIMAGTLSC